MQKYCSFFGHREIFGIEKVKLSVKSEIISLIENGFNCFIMGNNGQFDKICANCVKALKKIFIYKIIFGFSLFA